MVLIDVDIELTNVFSKTLNERFSIVLFYLFLKEIFCASYYQDIGPRALDYVPGFFMFPLLERQVLGWCLGRYSML